MKKYLLKSISFVIGISILPIVTSCSEDDVPPTNPEDLDAAANIDVTSANINSWRNYSLNVAKLLQNDAQTLYDSWNVAYIRNGVVGPAYKETFKNHSNSEYATANSCISTIIDKCVEITDEVGNTKIGDPYAKWVAGLHTEALYAVESWYSFRSREDYSNNIKSIRNSYYNSTDNTTINEHSLCKLTETLNPELNNRIIAAIDDAENAILEIPQPFRNNIYHEKVPVAQDACLALGEILNIELRRVITAAVQANTVSESELDLIVDAYVDCVVLPTYKMLSEKSVLLTQAVQNLYNSPSNDTFADACEAWKNAREPWEKSEAFLFGPVDALGLDPNMDSWPLDQVAIVNILNSGNYEQLNWTDNNTDDQIEASQGVRGFHTLEFLLFKNGNPRVYGTE